jgi:hypothetical protein
MGWITSDNVTSNDKMMARLEHELDTIGHEWKASDRRVRYEHYVLFGIILSRLLNISQVPCTHRPPFGQAYRPGILKQWPDHGLRHRDG